MRWLIGSAAALLLAAGGPAVAQRHEPANGHAKGHAKDATTVPHAEGSKARRGPPASRGKPDKEDGYARERDEYQTEVAWQKPGAVNVAGRGTKEAAAASGTRGTGSERGSIRVPKCPPGLAAKGNGCLPPGIARKGSDTVFGYHYSPTLFGVRNAGSASYSYRDGYLLPIDGTDVGYIPLLGGALAIGRAWPETYPSTPVPEYIGDYFDINDPERYRYADDVVYRIDPDTSAIEAVAALLTGSRFTVGSPLPAGYDIYNLPGAYRDRYVDTDDALYRYADGRIYEVDPKTMLIARAIDLIL